MSLELDEFPKFFRVQLAWAKILKGETASSYEIGVESDQSRAMVYIYSRQMSCLSDIVDHISNGLGRNSSVRSRENYPGDVCDSCDLFQNCFIRLLAMHPDNFKLIPPELRENEYFLEESESRLSR